MGSFKALTGSWLIFGEGNKNEVGELRIDNEKATELVGVFIGSLEIVHLVGRNESTLQKFIQVGNIIPP
jgi:hypothetical protein